MSLEAGKINVTADGTVVRTVLAEFIPVPFGRGAPIGLANDGTLYAGSATEGPGLEIVLLTSRDGGAVGRRSGSIGGGSATILSSGIRRSFAFGTIAGQ